VSEGLGAAADPWINKYRKTLEDDLVLIQSHVAHLELTGEPPNAEVLINGRPVGHLPMTAPIAVSIGEVDIELRAPGYRSGVRKVSLVTRQYERVFVRLEREAALAQGTSGRPSEETASATSTSGAAGATSRVATPIGQAPMRADPSGVSTPRRVLKWTSFGLAAAGLGTGITASIIHGQKVDDFERAHLGGCSEKGGIAVDASGQPVPECQSLLDSYHTARTWQVVGFAAAGVFAVGWLALLLTEPSPDGGGTSATAWIDWACTPSVSSARDASAACVVRF
jgi:hypothetical protein